MLYPKLEEKLRDAGRAFDRATTENIIGLGEQYLALLDEYRSKLYDHPGAPNSNLSPAPSSSWEAVADIKRAVRDAIDNTVKEYDRIAALLHSFTEMSGHEAVETLNGRRYKGHGDWKLNAGLVSPAGNDRDVMTIQEAVDAASLIRREEYIALSTASKGAAK
jgi:hypothetical protein